MKLGEVATYINGYAFKPSDWSTEGIPIIRIQDLTGSAYKTNFYNDEIAEKYKVVAGDVLISWSASLGVFVWDKQDAVLNQHIFKVVFDKLDVDKRFFMHQVKSILERAESETHGATMKHLTKPVFDALEFYLPSKNVQREIATTFDKIDRVIVLRKQQLQKLDELIKARFVEMFGDLKLNNKKWDVLKFGSFAKIDTEMVNDFQKYAEYPHIGIDSIEKNTGILRGYRAVAEDGVVSGKYLFTDKHIIYSKIRPNLNKVAMPTFTGLCSADAYPILPLEKHCNREFLAYVMRSPFYLDYILSFSDRTNLPKVNKQQVEGFSCPIPPIELQDEFKEFVQETDKSKLHVQKSLERLEILKKALMQKYFG